MKWITRESVKVDRVACPWLVKKFVDLVTIISGLDGRAFHSAVGAKHTAVTWLWLEPFAASSAVVEKEAGVGWHDFPALLPAMGAGND